MSRIARQVWVFALEFAPQATAAERAAFLEPAATGAAQLCAALGVSAVDVDFIESFEAETLADYGLARYLTEANGMDESAVATDTDLLNSLQGPLMLVFSQALRAGVLPQAQAPLRLVGHYTATERLDLPQSLESDSAEGIIAPPESKTISDAAMSGRIATVVLVVLFVLVAVMVWVAG